MAPVYIGLVHYPIYNKHMEVVTTALTNYDLHDIARTAKTYGVRTYFIIHPPETVQELFLQKLLSDSGYNGPRRPFSSGS